MYTYLVVVSGAMKTMKTRAMKTETTMEDKTCQIDSIAVNLCSCYFDWQKDYDISETNPGKL